MFTDWVHKGTTSRVLRYMLTNWVHKGTTSRVLRIKLLTRGDLEFKFREVMGYSNCSGCALGSEVSDCVHQLRTQGPMSRSLRIKLLTKGNR
jgi:hypothetical protein